MGYPTTENFIAIGINHWDAPVEIREKFSLGEENRKQMLEGARREGIHSLLEHPFFISDNNVRSV